MQLDNGREPAVRTAARRLAVDIMTGVYPVGSRLPVEPDLESHLGVGRSTVREAVKMLVSKGLLVVATRRGTIVRPASEWQQLDADLMSWRPLKGRDADQFMRHLAEIRSMIEPFAARQAALRRSDASVTTIYSALLNMRHASPLTPAAVDADIAFHEAVAKASGNPLLHQLVHSLEPALRNAFDVADLGLESAYKANLALHQDVVDAIVRQEPDKAAAACRRLIDRNEHDIEGARDQRARPMRRIRKASRVHRGSLA